MSFLATTYSPMINYKKAWIVLGKPKTISLEERIFLEVTK